MRMPPRLLLVDDDLVDRLSVQRALRAAGLDGDVREAQSQQEALAALKEREYDAVLLDFLLPDGDGLTLLQEMRRAGTRVPVIILTGQGDEQIAVELMKAGASDYLVKGQLRSDRLARAIHQALRIQQAERNAAIAERERARLFLLERAARDEAESAQQRLAFLADAGARLTASLELADTLQTAADLLVPSIGDWCFVDLADKDGFERVAIAHADPAAAPVAARLRRRFAVTTEARRGVARVIREGEPEVENDVTPTALQELARDEDHLKALETLGMRAYVTVPLPARGRTLGGLTVVSASRTYAEADVAFIAEVARRAAVAVDNARLYRDATSARERLRRQLDFTSAVMDSLAEGVLAVDETGAFTFVNAAAEAMLGRRGRDLLGQDAHAVLHGTCVDACPVGRALHAGGTLRDEGTFQAMDRGPFPVSIVASPIVTDGRRIGAVLAFHDVTERRRGEAELEASRRQLAMSEKLSALGTLVSGVAHELRTPLTYVANNLFLLRSRLETATRADPALAPLLQDVHAFGQAAMDGVDRINALVKDLRPFTQHDASARVLAPLEEVVAGAVGLFRATQRGHVEVVASLDPTPRVRLDRGQVQRVVINLLSNAAEAMPHGGRIHVVTRTVDGGAELLVEDSGPGIPPEVETRIFDPFFTTKPDGTGLGLSISRRIVEMHGGAIAYESKPGRGTRFTVRLPAERPPERATERDAAAPPA